MHHRVIACCRELARFTEEPGRTTRTFLSPPMRDVHRVLSEWMTAIGMSVWVDAAGNLHGLAGAPDAPRIMIGSHLDTVPNAGAFDGILGVVLGIAMAEMKPGIAIEVVGFSEEEGVRFGLPFIGSRALVGTLDAAVLAREDTHGVSVADAIRAFGLDPAEIPRARLSPHAIGYLEFHIEQGPVLESLGLALGVVETIAGQSRYLLTFEGRANHAGTTPMTLRHDALAAAAEWISSVETHARATPGLVATVGSLVVEPNAGNVIAGEVRATLDVRHAYDAHRHTAAQTLLANAHEICGTRRLTLSIEHRMDQAAVVMDPKMTSALRGHKMNSGAGHDAMVLAPHVPSAMLFVRSPGGISHHPDETVLPEDIEAAIEEGYRFLCRIS